MRRLLFLAIALSALASALPPPASAAPICVSTSSTNTDCGFIITLNPDGSFTGAAVAGANPYDGNDDALVGVINNTGNVYKGLLTLTGSGNGGGIFGFDGDGICSFVSAIYCGTAPTGYEGPLNAFTTIGAGGTSGTVDFSSGTGIPVAGATFFSLEGSPASILAGGGIGGTPVPEPMSLAMLGVGVGGMLLTRRRHRRNT